MFKRCGIFMALLAGIMFLPACGASKSSRLTTNTNRSYNTAPAARQQMQPANQAKSTYGKSNVSFGSSKSGSSEADKKNDLANAEYYDNWAKNEEDNARYWEKEAANDESNVSYYIKNNNPGKAQSLQTSARDKQQKANSYWNSAKEKRAKADSYRRSANSR